MTAAQTGKATPKGKPIAASTRGAKQPSEKDIEAARLGLNKIGNGANGSGRGAIDGTGKTWKTGDEDTTTRAAGEPKNELMPVPRPDPSVNKLIADTHRKMSELEDRRKEINADIESLKGKLEAKGIDRHTFMYQRRVLAKNENRRQSIDLTSQLVRQALGSPIQSDWISVTQGEDKQEH